MNKLLRSIDISKDGLLEQRSRGIGGTDASVIAGLNPYKSIFQESTSAGSGETVETSNPITP